MSARRLCLVALLICVGSCSGGKSELPATRGSAVPASPPATVTKSATATKPGRATKVGKSAAAPAAKPVLAPAPASVDGGTDAEKSAGPDELKTEEREANPYSESVTLKLNVTPSVKALVLWGAKQMAHLEPGHMDAEITRPRGSGPLDLEIKAEGYLPHHTRLYADRNDKISVRLCRVEDAPNLFGYRRSAEAKKAEVAKP